MSTRRVAANAGWVDPRKLPKGPNGRALCRRCSTEVPRGRRTFCSDACVHEHSVRSNPGYARRQVNKRDKGVCAVCGLDTEAMKARYWRIRRAIERRNPWRAADRRFDCYSKWHREIDRRMSRWSRVSGFEIDRRGHAWEMDHIKPVSEGGGECGLDNLRTLCIRCHKQATRELAARRSKKDLTTRHLQLNFGFEVDQCPA